MKAVTRRINANSYAHRVEIRKHELVVDEPGDAGGSDAGPSPQELLAASLATCTAITIEMYARRKQWDVGRVEVAVQYEPVQRGEPTSFSLEIMLGAELTAEQRERLLVIAGKCPVHRVLEGEVRFDTRIAS